MWKFKCSSRSHQVSRGHFLMLYMVNWCKLAFAVSPVGISSPNVGLCLLASSPLSCWFYSKRNNWNSPCYVLSWTIYVLFLGGHYKWSTNNEKHGQQQMERHNIHCDSPANSLLPQPFDVANDVALTLHAVSGLSPANHGRNFDTCQYLLCRSFNDGLIMPARDLQDCSLKDYHTWWVWWNFHETYAITVLSYLLSLSCTPASNVIVRTYQCTTAYR